MQKFPSPGSYRLTVTVAASAIPAAAGQPAYAGRGGRPGRMGGHRPDITSGFWTAAAKPRTREKNQNVDHGRFLTDSDSPAD